MNMANRQKMDLLLRVEAGFERRFLAFIILCVVSGINLYICP